MTLQQGERLTDGLRHGTWLPCCWACASAHVCASVSVRTGLREVKAQESPPPSTNECAHKLKTVVKEGLPVDVSSPHCFITQLLQRSGTWEGGGGGWGRRGRGGGGGCWLRRRHRSKTKTVGSAEEPTDMFHINELLSLWRISASFHPFDSLLLARILLFSRLFLIQASKTTKEEKNNRETKFILRFLIVFTPTWSTYRKKNKNKNTKKFIVLGSASLLPNIRLIHPRR